MPLVIPSGFQIASTDAVDARFSVADATARKALSVNNIYKGLLVFQQSDNKLYKLIDQTNPSIDSSWLEIGGVVTVNGVSPNTTNGNVVTSLTATYTGYSSSLDNQAPSLQASSSGDITASFANASLWIVSKETAPSRTGSNGETFIYISGSVGEWQKIPSFSEVAADARYLVKDTGGIVSGNIILTGSAELIGTSSWSDNATSAIAADGLTGGTQGYAVIFSTGNTVNTGSIFEPVGTRTIGINTTTTNGYNLYVSGSANVDSGLTVTGSLTASGSLDLSGSIYLRSLVTSSNTVSNVVMYGSNGELFTTASSAIGGSSTNVKSGVVTTFEGLPYSASVTLTTAFSDTNYSVVVTGEMARIFTISNKQTNKFTIDTNSSVAPNGNVYWIATSYNNS